MKKTHKKTIKILTLLLIIVVAFASCRKIGPRKMDCSSDYTWFVDKDDASQEYYYFSAPNTIVPDISGMNSHFKLKSNIPFTGSLKIFLGRRVIYETDDVMLGWDGKKGGKVKERNYKYEANINYANRSTKLSGTLTVALAESLENGDVDNCENCVFPDMIDARFGAIYGTELHVECD